MIALDSDARNIGVDRAYNVTPFALDLLDASEPHIFSDK